MAEPCTALPAQRMGSSAQKWLQQWLLLLLAVYTALSLSPVLSQGETFHSSVNVSCPVSMCHVLCRPSQCLGHLLPGDTITSLEGMRQCLTPVLGNTHWERLAFPKAFLPFSSCCCVLGFLPGSACPHPWFEMYQCIPQRGWSCWLELGGKGTTAAGAHQLWWAVSLPWG